MSGEFGGRFRIELSPLSRSKDRKLIAQFTSRLAQEAELAIDDGEAMTMAPRIMHAGMYQLGVVAEEIHNAIRVALRRGDAQLSCHHFGEAFANRTGNLSPFNPYLAESWASVDASRVLANDIEARAKPTKGGQ